jgi:uncharacterized protein
MIVAILRNPRRIKADRVCVDQLEEHTIPPGSRCRTLGGHDDLSDHQAPPARAVDLIEMYGPDQIMVNSPGD